MAADKKKRYTSDELKAMKIPEVRAIAKALKVSAAGLRLPDLVRAILKSQAAAAGKGTAASPAPKSKGTKPASKREVSEDDDSDDESDDADDEEEEIKVATKKAVKKSATKTVPTKTATKKVASKKPAAKEAVEGPESVEDVLELLVPLVLKLADFADIKAPKALKAIVESDEPEEAEEEEEDEEEEEAEEEEEEEEEEPEEDAEEEEEEEEEEESEDEEEELTEEAVMAADLSQLQEYAQKINKNFPDAGIDATAKSQKILRNSILKFIREYEGSENEVEDEETPKKGEGKPGWLKVDADVEGEYEGDWYKGTVTKVGKKGATVYFEEDESEMELTFDQIRQPKAKKKKSA